MVKFRNFRIKKHNAHESHENNGAQESSRVNIYIKLPYPCVALWPNG